MEFRMAIQVIDNFLEKEVFNNIKNIILGDNFPWYYNDFMTRDPDKKLNIVKCKEILPKGSLVVFPSFVWHRVCPVKKGERNSLVIWNLGWPFK